MVYVTNNRIKVLKFCLYGKKRRFPCHEQRKFRNSATYKPAKGGIKLKVWG